MCEILFRAKAINRDIGSRRTKYKNGDWVYGLLTKTYDERFENLPAEMTDTSGISGIEVNYKTIGQFTGLTDKNGVKIFEGDIVTLPGEDNPCEIVWNDTEAKFEFKSFDITADFDNYWAQELEVIANKYDYDDPNCWEEW